MEGDSNEDKIKASNSNISGTVFPSGVSKKKNDNLSTDSEKKKVPNSIGSQEYYMNNRGKCIIINEKNFERHISKKERKGTDLDASSLEECFRELNFDVERRDNLRKHEILDWLNEIAKDNDYHSLSDCFVCCILSHGNNGLIYSTDCKIPTEEIFELFAEDKCDSLAGKPKIFFIQACQGDEPDPGVKLIFTRDSADYSTAPLVWTKLNFLIANSTVPGYLSWRDKQAGSLFIQTLCKVLQKNSGTKDLLSMMTDVAQQVSLYFESYRPKEQRIHEKKQVSCITSTLTQKVYFNWRH